MAKKHRPRPVKPKPKPPVPIREENLHRYSIIALFILPLFFYGRLLFSGAMMFGTDFIGAGGYAAHQFMADYIRKHLTIAFWQPQILCGQPTVAAFYGDLFYPTIFLRLFLPVHIVWSWTFYLQTCLAGLGTYFFLKELKLNTISAFLAGVAYMFSGSILTLAYAGHDGRLIGTSLMPLAIFFLTRGMNRRQIIWFALTGMILALQLLSGHIQKVYYTGLILAAWFLFNLIRTIKEEKKAQSALTPSAPSFRTRRGIPFWSRGASLIGYFVLTIIFAGALAAIQYLPIYGNLPYGARGAERGYEFATSWSMPIAETFDLLTPNFSGGLWNYWSKNPFKLHSEYLGILPLLFALIALCRSWRKPEVKFFFFTFIIALLMAWGGNTPFYRIPYYLLPGLNKFRGPGMIFFIAGFSISALSGYGINYLLTSSEPAETRKGFRFLLYAGGVLFLLFLFFLSARNAAVSIFAPGPRLAQFEANYPALTTGILFSVIIWFIGTGIVFFVIRNRLNPLFFNIIVTLLMTLDIGISLKLWDNNKGYIRTMPPPQEHFAPDEVVRFLKNDTSLYRVLPLHYERSDEGELWLYNIHSTGGQMPNPLQTYQDFIGAGPSVMFQANNLLNANFMNLLNVKYIITYNLPEDVAIFDAQTQQIINQLKLYFSQPQFNQVFTGARYSIYENRNFLPRAFITPNYEVVKNKEELLSRLMQQDFNPSQTALLYEEPDIKLSCDTFALTPIIASPEGVKQSPPGVAEIISYDANAIKVRVNLTTPGLLILSENYHPDWQVTVDGKPAKLLQAFHTLRAVFLSAGKHDVIFFYKSNYYHLGVILTLLAFCLLALMGGMCWIKRRKKLKGYN